MSKFNSVNPSSKKISYEGGFVFEKGLEDDWINFLFSSMLSDTFYESGNHQQDRYTELTKKMIEKYGPAFVAKAAVYSRKVMGLRSISSLTAAILNEYKWDTKRYFYENFFNRPDDVAEVFAAIKNSGNKYSHGLQFGAKKYLNKLNDYQLSKYKLNGKEYNMYDIIRITHAYSESINRYLHDELKSPETWENKVINAKNEKEKENWWKKLVEEDKLGYIALIRNLRNILKCSFANETWVKNNIVTKIVDEIRIKKSMIYPYQIYVAYKNISEITPIYLDEALEKAFIISIGNMPKFKGSTAIILDVSGSMTWTNLSYRNNMNIAEVGALYSAILYLSDNDVDFFEFATKYEQNTYSKTISPFKLIDTMMKDGQYLGGGTNIGPVIKNLPKHYDRILLFSDMQVMADSWNSPIGLFNEYKKEYGNTSLYSFDLANYGTQIVPRQDGITYITALNEKVFNFIEYKESGKNLIDVIDMYEF